MFNILRVAKLKTLGNVGGAAAHNNRSIPTNNADRSIKNMTIGAVKNTVEAVKERLEQYGIVPRKNAVIANEIVISASPEFFKGKSRKEIKEWAKDQIKFVKKEMGEKSFIAAWLHLDETTPHLQIIVTPLYENQKGQTRLAAKQYFDRFKLSAWQTKHYEWNKDKYPELNRGLENSKAKHTELKDFYKNMSAAVHGTEKMKEILNEKLAPKLIGAAKYWIERCTELTQIVEQLTAKIFKLEKQVEKVELQNGRLRKALGEDVDLAAFRLLQSEYAKANDEITELKKDLECAEKSKEGDLEIHSKRENELHNKIEDQEVKINNLKQEIDYLKNPHKDNENTKKSDSSNSLDF